MPDFEDFSGWGSLAKVVLVDDERKVYVRSFTGETGILRTRANVDLAVGDVILIHPDGRTQQAPASAWPDESWIAVVRVKDADWTVVEFAGNARKIPTNHVDYHVGDTVEADHDGVVSVLSDEPLKSFYLYDLLGELESLFDEDTINHFMQASASAWTNESWIAVVRIKNHEWTVVEFAGNARKIPTNQVDYHVGNTVEANHEGVISVLSIQPLKSFDLPELQDEDIVTEFLVTDPVTQSFEDFGGLADVVDRARKLIEVPLKHRAALTKIGARPVKGVLFTGEPGTGKTMLARIIAHEARAAFYQIKGPEIVSKWLGQSEEVLRALFGHAQKQDNAIIFFDEIDSIASHRDNDVHEASRRMVAQFLTLMDGYTPTKNLIVIAATNRPQDIDVALRRPGRFDWEIHFPLPTRPDREQILKVSSRKLRVLSQLPHHVVADATDLWSAADLTSIWTEAALIAAVQGREAISPEDYLAGLEAVRTQRAEKAVTWKRPRGFA